MPNLLLYLWLFIAQLIIFTFHFRVEPTKLTFIILGASMAGLSIMILVVSSLATGSTRHEVYRTSSGRTYGRIGKRNYMFSLFLSL